MRRRMMKSKIHRATVTDANLNYVGSITIDAELMRLADVLPYEQVAVLDLDNDGTPEAFFTDDGSGTWAVAADRGGPGALPGEAGNPPAGRGLRWFGLDGVEHTGGSLVDFEGHGHAGDRLIDSDGDGVADRVLCPDETGVTGYVDTDGDGKWDVRLTDSDGDGLADGASTL